MSTDNQIWQMAESYVSGMMPDAERTSLLHELQTDTTFAAAFQECVGLLRSLQGNAMQSKFRATIQNVHEQAENKQKPATRTIPLRSSYLRTAAIAAGVAAITAFSTMMLIRNGGKQNSSEYTPLVKKIQNIDARLNQQSKVIQDIKTKNDHPVAAAKTSGTGFALTNDGYLVTNYHVTAGADSVYIQNHDGKYFKARIVNFDAQHDIAILKVEEKNFRFSKTEVPYTFSSDKADLGARIYSLGFPDEQIIYNEGYVSGRQGFDNDSMQYRLELPADPGQSGSPVWDNNGRVIAIVTAKNNHSEDNTYAVSSEAVLALAKDEGIHLPKSNKLGRMGRTQQISRLQYYTCCIKVYKK